MPVWKRKTAPISQSHFYTEHKRLSLSNDPSAFDNTPKPTRFEWPDEELPSLATPFDDGISYTSKPLLTQDDEPRPSTSHDEPNRKTNYYSSGDDSHDGKGMLTLFSSNMYDSLVL